VEDATKSITKRYHESKGVLSYPYESVYAEVRGYLKGKAKLGYAEDYENVLVVTKVISMKQKSFGTECYDFEYFGVGNEPFWALEIIPSENIIALKDVGHEKTYTFPYSSGKNSGNTTTYESRNDKNETIKAIIKKETCSDGMSDRIYNHSIRLVINDRILNGCAIKKGDKMPQNR
jgi:putative lipoprotein